MYHLPLLPGYGPNANIRSSLPAKLPTGKSILAQLSEAEEDGYQGTYFNTPHKSDDILEGGYISGTPPDTRNGRRIEDGPTASDIENALDGLGGQSETEFFSDIQETHY